MGEVKQFLEAGAQPERDQILRAKSAVLEQLDGGPQTLGSMEKRHRDSEGAGLNFGEIQLGSTDTAMLEAVLTRDFPQIAGMRARVAVELAVAELVAAGLVLPLAPMAPDGLATPSFSLQVTAGSQMFSTSAEVTVDVARPVLLSSRYMAIAGLRTAGAHAWRFDAAGFTSGLGSIQLDARTNRCAEEAFEAYVRGAFLASASLLGAVVEGTWYQVAEARRTKYTNLGKLIDGSNTAQLQKALCAHYRTNVKGSAWRFDDLERDAALFREIRNYGVHPRGVASSDVERHLHEDTCGLLISTARTHLLLLAEVDGDLT